MREKVKGAVSYHTLQNFIYIMKGARKWEPSLLLFMPMWSLAEGFLPFIWLYAARLIIARVEKGLTGSFIFFLIVIIGAALLELILTLMQQIASKKVESRTHYVRTNFMLKTIRKVMTMPYVMMEDPNVLDAKSRSDKAVIDMVNGLEGIMKKMPLLFGYLLMMAVSTFILWSASPVLVMIMLALSFLGALFGERYVKWEKDEISDPLVPILRKAEYFERATSDIEAAKDIRLFDMKDFLMQKLTNIHNDITKKTFLQMDVWAKCIAKQDFVAGLQEAIMYAILIYGLLKGQMGIAEFTLFIGSVRNFNFSVSSALGFITEMRKDNRYLCDFRAFLDWPENNPSNGEISEYVTVPKADSYTFIFENVSFRYPGREEYALKNLNLTVEAQKRLAVVGLNGAGKTTFIKLLCRLYEPTEGIIYLNGIDVRKFRRKDYYELISPVFQNVECFAFPLAENISMNTKENTSRQKAADCLKKAGMGEKLEEFPHGIDTELLRLLKPDGIELSGGEMQKMALARALYKDAPIIILDEPTAALDPLAEYQSYMNFDSLIGEKTAIYISHRLSSTRFCQSIAMFASGEMIEYGTHEVLMEKNGAYAEMFALQAQYYKEGISYE